MDTSAIVNLVQKVQIWARQGAGAMAGQCLPFPPVCRDYVIERKIEYAR